MTFCFRNVVQVYNLYNSYTLASSQPKFSQAEIGIFTITIYRDNSTIKDAQIQFIMQFGIINPSDKELKVSPSTLTLYLNDSKIGHFNTPIMALDFIPTNNSAPSINEIYYYGIGVRMYLTVNTSSFSSPIRNILLNLAQKIYSKEASIVNYNIRGDIDIAISIILIVTLHGLQIFIISYIFKNQ